MRKDGNIVSYTVEELEEMRARGEGKTDWARVDAMTPRTFEPRMPGTAVRLRM